MYSLVGVAMDLYNELGYGLAEPIYQECLSILCTEEGIPWQREKPLDMYFHGQLLKKKYIADFVCFDDIIVEMKAVSSILNEHRAQLFNYLRITHGKAGMILNFGNPQRLISERYIYNEQTDSFDFVK
jgi:GxxExxY protein